MTQVAALRTAPTDPHDLVALAEFFRLDATRRVHRQQRSKFGQFFTPAETAALMASMITPRTGRVRIIDPGAGVGSLSAALVAATCAWPKVPSHIHLTAYEIDDTLTEYLASLLKACETVCARYGIGFEWDVRQHDFVRAAVDAVRGDLFRPERIRFDYAILNPPYRKIRSDSPIRELLSEVGIETTNLYAAFLALSLRLLDDRGQLVAITPRSFCNGPYFRPFRRILLGEATLRRVHVFETRDHAFREDAVLQENVILHAVKGLPREKVAISSSIGATDYGTTRQVPYDEVVRPEDLESFIHVVPEESGKGVADRMGELGSSLTELGLSVSTGPVVDFRVKPYLRKEPSAGDAPLLYPGNLTGGRVHWPKEIARKPSAIAVDSTTCTLLVPSGIYVLVKRFSAKEERRRLVAAVFEPSVVAAPLIGFENHLNYFHVRGAGLPIGLANGLALFLNSTLADAYFRQFSGHTQVNATDLRSLRYPRRDQLEALAARIGDQFPERQEDLDSVLEEVLFPMAAKVGEGASAGAGERIQEAIEVLGQLGLPPSQQNDRSGLALLALLNLHPDTPWRQAKTPLRGVTEIMDYVAEHYGWRYAPNTRETFRRQTLHQFVAAGLAIPNPDDPARPTNSPDYCYQIEASAVEVLRAHGTKDWEPKLREYLAAVVTLKRRYAAEREMAKIPLQVAPGKEIHLSPGGQNELVEKIITEFCPRFTPAAKVLYVGDTGKKWAYFDEALLQSVGVEIEAHGKMPDVVVLDEGRGWLVLIEAVTSHGPVDAKRREELEALFRGSMAGLVFATAFLTRRDLLKYLGDIAWETEVWVAESPSHMIHFNGERFLGPY